jgi:hypothetical protein
MCHNSLGWPRSRRRTAAVPRSFGATKSWPRECGESCCAATALPRAPAAHAACVCPSRDSAGATPSPVALTRCRCVADYDAACASAQRFPPLPVRGSVAPTDILWGARSHKPRTKLQTGVASALPPPQTAPAAPAHPSFSRPFFSPPPRAALTRGSVKDVSGRFVKDVMGLNKSTRGLGRFFLIVQRWASLITKSKAADEGVRSTQSQKTKPGPRCGPGFDPLMTLLWSEAFVRAQAHHVLEHGGSGRQIVRIQELRVEEIVTSGGRIDGVAALEYASCILRIVHADH